MTVQDNNFLIKNGLSVGTGKHQVLDSNGRITGNYFTLNAGGRYLSAGVDLWDLMSTQGIPPLSTNAWNSVYASVMYTSGDWDSVYSFVNADSATNNTNYNRTTFVNVTGDTITGELDVLGSVNLHDNTYVEGSLRVDGHTYLSAAMYVENDSYIMGDLRVDGDVWLAVETTNPKSIYLGATNLDRVVFYADVDSNIIPDDDVTYDLGTSTQQWRELFVQDISATNDIFVDNDLLVSSNGTIGEDFRVSGHTTVGGDTVLSGTLDVKGFTTLHDDLSVRGDMYVDGNAYLSAGVDGNIYVGDVDTDNVIFRADVDSGIKPDDNVTYDLGTSTQQWRELFVQDISATNDIFVDNDLLVSANGTIGTDFRVSGATVVGGYTELSGTLDVKDFTTLHDDLSVIGDMYVDGSVFLSAGTSGKIVFGTDNTDNVVFNADVDSNIIPDDDVTYDLGTSTQQWRELFVQDISATNDIFVDNDLIVSANGTIGTDFRVSGHTTVGGDTVLSGTLDVKDFTTLHDDLSVIGDMYVDGNVFLSGGQSGDIYLGTGDDDNVVFNADVNSNIIPESAITFDLGTDDKHWRNLFVHDVSASNDIRVQNTLYTDTIRTDDRNYLHIAAGSDDTAGSFVRLFQDNRMFVHADYINFGDLWENTDNYTPWVMQIFTDEQQIKMDSTLDVSMDATFKSDVWIQGDLRVDGNAWLSAGVNGVVYVGDTNTDNVVFRADVDSNIIPDDDVTYDLGTSTQQWRELFVQDISASNDVFVDNDLLVSANGTIGTDFRVSGHTTVGGDTVLSGTLTVDDTAYIYDTLDVELDTRLHGDLFVSNNTTISGNTVLSGALDVDGAANFHDTLDVELKTTLHSNLLVSGNTHIVGDLRVDGNAWLSAGVDGIINVGDTNTDNVVFRADIDSGLTPNKDTTYDLGTSTQQWRELFVQNISATNDIFVDNDLLVSANGTIGTDFRVSGHTTVGGDTVLSGTLDVDDATYVYDTLDVELDTHLHGDLYVTNNTTISGNTVLSGALDVKEFTTLHADLSVKGDLFVDGNTYLSAGASGDIYVGDTDTDSVVFRADINSDIIPDINITYDLGTNDKHWGTLYVNDVSASNDARFSGRVYTDIIESDQKQEIILKSTDDTNPGSHVYIGKNNINLHSDAFNFGDIFESSDNYHPWILTMQTDQQKVNVNGELTVLKDSLFKQNVDVWGNIKLGDSSNDNVVFVADVSSNIIPDDDTTYDLGTSEQQWRELFVRDISATGDVTIDDKLTVQGHVSAVSGMTLTGDLTADDSVYIKGNIVVEGHAYFGYGADSNQINLGDPNVDEIVVHADIGSDLIPFPGSTHDLGMRSKRWRSLFVDDVDATGTIQTTGNISTSGAYVQSKSITFDQHVQTIENVWRSQSGQPHNTTLTVETFDHTKYQSAQYTIMIQNDPIRTGDNSVTTVNASFVSDGTTINGTVYGNVNVGSADPLVDVNMTDNNNMYTLNITVSPYAKMMVTGKAMFLQ